MLSEFTVFSSSSSSSSEPSFSYSYSPRTMQMPTGVSRRVSPSVGETDTVCTTPEGMLIARMASLPVSHTYSVATVSQMSMPLGQLNLAISRGPSWKPCLPRMPQKGVISSVIMLTRKIMCWLESAM